MKLGFKIWLLIFVLLFSLISIFGIPPKFLDSGVIVTSIGSNTTLYNQGLKQGQIINSLDGQSISNLQDYTSVLSGKFHNGTNVKLILGTSSGEYTYYGDSFPDLTVGNAPKTSLSLGLDLAGGARAIVKAQNHSLTSPELTDLVSITENRLNAFGLTDLQVSPISDLSGNNYMEIDIAGATPKDLRDLVSKQGKFEAKIGNETVFEGGSRDVASVGRDAQSASIDSCNPDGSGAYYCSFHFNIVLSPAAAQKSADATANLTSDPANKGYLSKKLELYLDDVSVENLSISEGLKGRVTTQIQISGSGTGSTQDEALKDAKAQMKKLQTILLTGSLPFKLEIIKLDTISPLLGNEFSGYILLAGLIAILSVSVILFVRYRRWKASLALILTTVSEVVIILGIAAFIKWNLDLPSIAGILATIGTGVDDLVVLMDETGSKVALNIKQRLKRAFSIILGAYFTTLVSLIPLFWAGAGLLKGFALTTIIGISVGVFITRPAFGELLKRSRKE